MKNIDLNLIKFVALFSNSEYKKFYDNSKQYKHLLPEMFELGSVYSRKLMNFCNMYSVSLPDSFKTLNILIGCKQYKIIINHKVDHYSLYLFFHCVDIRTGKQTIRDEILSDFDVDTGKYIYNEVGRV